MSKIVCLGILVADAIAKPVDMVPEKGKLGLVDTIELHTGGCAANASIDLAKMGQDVGIIGLVGCDGFGEFILNRLKTQKVDIAGLKITDKTTTSASLVLSNSDGERTFIHCYGTNAVFSEKDIDMNIIEKCELLFVAGSLLMPAFDGKPTANILRKAREMGKYTILDTAWDPTGRWMSAIGPCLPYLDLFIPSIEEAQMMSGKENEKDMAEYFLEMGAKNIVIKLGHRGCYIKNKNEEHHVDAFKVDAVDTTGAGDAFVAGFITGLVNGWNLRRCGEFANAVGAHCVIKMGSSEGIKSMEEIISFIEKRRNWDDNQTKL